MNKIYYHYSSVSKQAWFYSCALYLVIWMFVFMEIKILRIQGYYEQINLLYALILLGLGFILFISLSFQHFICYSLYDNEKITYYNRLLRKEKTFYYKDCHAVIFDKTGVKFYKSQDDLVKKLKPLFYIPFFRFGKIEAIPINKFYMMLEQRQEKINNPQEFSLFKSFKVLPGYGIRWKYLSFFYACLCIICVSSCATPLAIAIGILKLH